MEKIIDIKSIDPISILGIADCNLKIVQSEIPISIVVREQKLKIIGGKDNVKQAGQILFEMIETLNSKGSLHKDDVRNLISMIKMNVNKNGRKRINYHHKVCYSKKGTIKTKTEGQIKYFKTVNKNDVVFCNGPAGTGKTFLAVCFAISALENNLIDKIILCRPAVEAGENLGFLPGDLKDKVDRI